MADLLDSLCFCDSVRQTPVHYPVLFAGLLYLQGHIFHMDVLPPHRWSQHRLFEIFEASAQDDTLQSQEDAELTPDWFDNFKILIFFKLIHLIHAMVKKKFSSQILIFKVQTSNFMPLAKDNLQSSPEIFTFASFLVKSLSTA